jgi:hypothetical protein
VLDLDLNLALGGRIVPSDESLIADDDQRHGQRLNLKVLADGYECPLIARIAIELQLPEAHPGLTCNKPAEEAAGFGAIRTGSGPEQVDGDRASALARLMAPRLLRACGRAEGKQKREHTEQLTSHFSIAAP